eukprot:6177832-Pleurochrysis_carterae.AAC.1
MISFQQIPTSLALERLLQLLPRPRSEPLSLLLHHPLPQPMSSVPMCAADLAPQRRSSRGCARRGRCAG